MDTTYKIALGSRNTLQIFRKWYCPLEKENEKVEIKGDSTIGCSTDFLDNYCDHRKSIVPGMHPGIDIGGSVGDEVYAMTDGEVKAIFDKWAGTCVVITHRNIPKYIEKRRSWKKTTFDAIYAHLQAVESNIKVGEKIKAGQKLGEIMSMSSGDHLHLQIERNYGSSPYWPTAWSTNSRGYADMQKNRVYIVAKSRSDQEKVINQTWDPKKTLENRAATVGKINSHFEKDENFNACLKHDKSNCKEHQTKTGKCSRYDKKKKKCI